MLLLVHLSSNARSKLSPCNAPGRPKIGWAQEQHRQASNLPGMCQTNDALLSPRDVTFAAEPWKVIYRKRAAGEPSHSLSMLPSCSPGLLTELVSTGLLHTWSGAAALNMCGGDCGLSMGLGGRRGCPAAAPLQCQCWRPSACGSQRGRAGALQSGTNIQATGPVHKRV